VILVYLFSAKPFQIAKSLACIPDFLHMDVIV